MYENNGVCTIVRVHEVHAAAAIQMSKWGAAKALKLAQTPILLWQKVA